ncbi:hypothetical protein QYE76_057179 [Lolium multiflorum]|uniref:Uncharacterized protein n=1 Tax=Lolium multiflorum TaxID=4521 RepID=A0AAD8T3X6_LOLMU|nr:hypothetical protein QYE76_057179 [Lolium multiflorum]
MDLVAQSDVLNKPITPEEAADPEALEAKRQEMLATAQKFAKTAAAMLEERTIAANFVDHFQKKDREVDESLEKQPLATPKDNMKKAAELLKKKDEEIDINYVRKLVASAMQQQSKADTSRRLESNPEHCISTAQKDATASQHRDGESRTGSTERRRKVREHPNPIPVPSDSTPKNPVKGKDPMYTGRDKYRVPSPPPRASRPPLPPRRRSLGTPGPMGRVESTSATTCRLLGTGAGAYAGTTRSRNQDREHEPRRNQERDHEPRKPRTRACGRAGRRARTEQRRSSDGGDRPSGKEPPAEPATGATRESKAEDRLTASQSLATTRWRRWAEAGDPFRSKSPGARVWLIDLEENTIFCWLDPKKAFENHFRGTYKRPATTGDLQACIRKKGETSSFLTRWLATRNECENVDNRTAMHAFIGGLQRGGLLRHKLTCLVNANKLTLDEMINIASDHTAADDDAGGDLAAIAIPLQQEKP